MTPPTPPSFRERWSDKSAVRYIRISQPERQYPVVNRFETLKEKKWNPDNLRLRVKRLPKRKKLKPDLKIVTKYRIKTAKVINPYDGRYYGRHSIQFFDGELSPWTVIQWSPLVYDFLQDKENAKDFYRAFCNVEWKPIGAPDSELFGVSFRAAGSLVAGARRQWEDYLDFYMTEGYGSVSWEVEDIMYALGFEEVENSDG